MEITIKDSDMGGELTTRQAALKSILWYEDRENLELFKTVILGPGFSDQEMKLALGISKETGMNPITRQIYFVKRGGRMVPQTSIDGFRSRADETGQYAGSDDPVYDEGLNQFQMLKAGRKRPVTASVTVWKIVQGVRSPFTATATWEGYYVSSGGFWDRMPFLMLGKCAEALALRKAFPAKLGSIYIKEEMMQAGTVTAGPKDDEELPPIQKPARKVVEGTATVKDVVQKAEEKHDEAKANGYQPQPEPPPEPAPSDATPKPTKVDNYPGEEKISESQRRLLFKTYHDAGWTDEAAKDALAALNIFSSTMIPKSMFTDILKMLGSAPPKES